MNKKSERRLFAFFYFLPYSLSKISIRNKMLPTQLWHRICAIGNEFYFYTKH